MNERFDKFTAVEFVVAIGIMHFEVVELELLLRHVTCIDGHIHVLFHMSELDKRIVEVVINISS